LGGTALLTTQENHKQRTFFKPKIKFGLLTTGLVPLVYSIGAYFLKLGFLDGKVGFYLAQFKSHYFFQIQTKVDSLKSDHVKKVQI
jgi:hypothetical protein